jgi:glycine cleavage system H protein
MVPAIVALTVVVILLVNLGVHACVEFRCSFTERRSRRRALREVTAPGAFPDSPTLRRARVERGQNLIVVGRDPKILDRLRTALVGGGYGVDTVESTSEATALLEAVEHAVLVVAPGHEAEHAELLRAAASSSPPVDVLLLTAPGATAQTAGRARGVASLPVTARPRRIRAALRTVLAAREERLAHAHPQARLVTPDRGALRAPDVINVPAGLFFARNHTWISIQPNGEVRVGLDEFAAKLLASAIDDVDLPLPHDPASASTPLFSIHQGQRSLAMTSPIAGQVIAVNSALVEDPGLINVDPYAKGWVCSLRAENLLRDLDTLQLGEQALEWTTSEIERHLREREAEARRARRSLSPLEPTPAHA